MIKAKFNKSKLVVPNHRDKFIFTLTSILCVYMCGWVGGCLVGVWWAEGFLGTKLAP
jgi:hypothetical protein